MTLRIVFTFPRYMWRATKNQILQYVAKSIQKPGDENDEYIFCPITIHPPCAEPKACTQQNYLHTLNWREKRTTEFRMEFYTVFSIIIQTVKRQVVFVPICLVFVILIFRLFGRCRKVKSAVKYLYFMQRKAAVWAAKNPDYIGVLRNMFYVPFCGGKGGIRTLERVLAVTRFPVVRLRPAQPPFRVCPPWSIHIQRSALYSRSVIIAWWKSKINTFFK